MSAKKLPRASLFWWLLPLLCGATATIDCSPASPQTVTLTEENNGTTVTVNVGDRIVARLPVTMGTGYSWSLTREESEVLRLEGKAEQEQPEKSRPGGTEMQVFRFIAQHKGEVSLELHYVRPWEKGVRPSKTFSVMVRVH